MRYLLIFLMISGAGAAEIVPNSFSSDHQLQIAVELKEEFQPRYRVTSRNMHFLRGSFPSDYWTVDACLGSRVCWRPDGEYFVIEETSSGIHQEFVVARKTLHGYSAMPFDRNDIMISSKLHWHHGFVRFDKWLPKDRLEITICGDLDGSREDFECRFVLDLKRNFRVLSCDIIKPR